MKNKHQKQLLLMSLLVGAGYYFFIHLPEEEERKKAEQKLRNQQTNNKTPEQLKKEREKDAWQKGRIWELPAKNWADKIIAEKRSSLTKEYQKDASWFPDGDRNSKFKFSRSAPYKIFFPPSLREYYENGKSRSSIKDKCYLVDKKEDLILSDEINSWVERTIKDPTRGNFENGLGNNALFYGAPGTGKTATMKNICARADKYPLVVILGSNLTPTESDQSAEILPLQKFAYTISELEWVLEKECGMQREDNGEVRYMLFVDEANQISNNSLIFQPNQLKILKDCLEGVDKKESSKNLWTFATNHRDQVEKATFRKGRLSNPLDFTWNWKIFKDHCERNNVNLPERWEEEGQLTPEEEKWLAEFNIDVFDRYFLGDDEDEPNRKPFWNLFIEENPDAKYIPKSKQKDSGNEEWGDDEEIQEEKEVEIEIGEFLEFFWHIKEKYSTSFDGKYKSAKKNTIEIILETRLSELIKTTDSKLNKIVEELEKTREEGKEQIMGGIEDIVQILANK